MRQIFLDCRVCKPTAGLSRLVWGNPHSISERACLRRITGCFRRILYNMGLYREVSKGSASTHCNDNVECYGASRTLTRYQRDVVVKLKSPRVRHERITAKCICALHGLQVRLFESRNVFVDFIRYVTAAGSRERKCIRALCRENDGVFLVFAF